MNSEQRDPAELRRAGWQALVNELGLADAMRFTSEYDPGRGNYTKDRHAIIGDPTIGELVADTRA